VEIYWNVTYSILILCAAFFLLYLAFSQSEYEKCGGYAKMNIVDRFITSTMAYSMIASFFTVLVGLILEVWL